MSRRDKVALAGVLALAALMRLPFIGYGLPEAPWVDAFQFVGEAHRLAFGEGTFEPNDFMYPGLMKLVLAGIYAVFDIRSPAWLHTVVRLVATAFDLGTVALIFIATRRSSAQLGAIAAAVVYAVAVVPVTSSRLETTDTMLTFFLTASLVVMTRPSLRPRDFVFAGTLIGLAMGAKLTGLYGGLCLAMGVVLAWRQGVSPARGLLFATVGGLVSLVVFCLTTPWLFEYLDVFTAAVKVQIEAQRYGQIGHVQESALAYLVSSQHTPEQPWLPSSLGYALGPVVLAGMAVGLVVAFRGRRGAAAIAFAVYALLFLFLVSGAGRVKAVRYVLPTLPALAVMVGLAVDEVASLAKKRWAQGVLLSALAVVPLYKTVPFVLAGRHATTNAVAADWVGANIPPGTRVLLTPFYLENLAALPIEPRRFKGAAQTQYRLRDSIGVDTEAKPVYRPDLVDKMPRAGIRYVILNSYFEGSLYDTEENRRFFPKTVAAYAAFRGELDQKATRVWAIEGWSAGRLGPDIGVYALKTAGDQSPTPGANAPR